MPKKDDEKVSVPKDEVVELPPIARPAKVEKEEVRPETKQKIEDVPRAVPSKHVEEQVTAMGLATVQKFIGGSWRTVHKGRPFTGPKHVVEALKRAKFVQ